MLFFGSMVANSNILRHIPKNFGGKLPKNMPKKIQLLGLKRKSQQSTLVGMFSSNSCKKVFPLDMSGVWASDDFNGRLVQGFLSAMFFLSGASYSKACVIISWGRG